MSCCHEWARRGNESLCLLCGCALDEPSGFRPKKKRLKAKAWQRVRKKMLQRIRRK